MSDVLANPAKGGGGHDFARPEVTAFFDPHSSSLQYVVADPATGACAVVDPVLDYDEKSGATATRSADALLDFIAERGLRLEWIIYTHPHADHFSAAGYLKDRSGAPTATGAEVVQVQRLWQRLYNLPDSFRTDGSQWDRLFAGGERFRIGRLEASVLFSPGHTLASVTYLVGDAAFIHDTLFMPDSGSARADFPGGDARSLVRAQHPAHPGIAGGDAAVHRPRLPAGWAAGGLGKQRGAAEGGERAAAGAGRGGLRGAALRARDRTLPMPRLMLHALQVNIAGGRLPEPEADGRRYLKIPLDALGDVPRD